MGRSVCFGKSNVTRLTDGITSEDVSLEVETM